MASVILVFSNFILIFYAAVLVLIVIQFGISKLMR